MFLIRFFHAFSLTDKISLQAFKSFLELVALHFLTLKLGFSLQALAEHKFANQNPPQLNQGVNITPPSPINGSTYLKMSPSCQETTN